MPVMKCPECRAKLEFDESRYGAQVECPKCGSPLVLADQLVIDTSRDVKPPAATLKRSRFEVSKPTFLSGAALTISFIALMFAAWERPRGLQTYDFSTPKAAFLSEVAMEEASDLEAIKEYELLKARNNDDDLRDPATVTRTVKVFRVSDLDGGKVVWFELVSNGIRKNGIRFLRFSESHNMWIESQLPPFERFPEAFSEALIEWDSRSGKIVEADAE